MVTRTTTAAVLPSVEALVSIARELARCLDPAFDPPAAVLLGPPESRPLSPGAESLPAPYELRRSRRGDAAAGILVEEVDEVIAYHATTYRPVSRVAGAYGLPAGSAFRLEAELDGRGRASLRVVAEGPEERLDELRRAFRRWARRYR